MHVLNDAEVERVRVCKCDTHSPPLLSLHRFSTLLHFNEQRFLFFRGLHHAHTTFSANFRANAPILSLQQRTFQEEISFRQEKTESADLCLGLAALRSGLFPPTSSLSAQTKRGAGFDGST